MQENTKEPLRMQLGHDLLRIENLSISFPLVRGHVHAVKDASLRVLPGKVTALVGESGSGKSVISQTVMGLQPDFAQVAGRVLFDDPDATTPTDLLQLARDGRRLTFDTRASDGDDLSGTDDVILGPAYGGKPDQRSASCAFQSVSGGIA